MTIQLLIDFCQTNTFLALYTGAVIGLLWVIPWAISKRS
jgi:hypothetical protein